MQILFHAQSARFLGMNSRQIRENIKVNLRFLLRNRLIKCWMNTQFLIRKSTRLILINSSFLQINFKTFRQKFRHFFFKYSLKDF